MGAPYSQNQYQQNPYQQQYQSPPPPQGQYGYNQPPPPANYGNISQNQQYSGMQTQGQNTPTSVQPPNPELLQWFRSVDVSNRG